MITLYEKHSLSLLRVVLVMIIVVGLFVLPSCAKKSGEAGGQSAGNELKGTITISGAFALYPMTVKWSEEFRKLYPDVRIDISAGGAGKGMADALSGTVDLGMFSRAIMQEEINQGVWWVAVTKDAVLATISAQNPVLQELRTKGLKRAQFMDIFINGTSSTWGEVAGCADKHEINVYTRSDACGAAGTWALYLGGSQEDLKGIGIFGDPGLAEAVKKDPYGIGFNNTIYIYSSRTNLKYNGLEVIPIDINENGKIDDDENFYDQMQQVMDAIARGIYPSPPARELYLVSKGKPENPCVLAFLKWILSEGQKYVSVAGYVPLDQEVIKSETAKLQ